MSVRDLAPDVLSKIMGLIINLRNLNSKLERNVFKDSIAKVVFVSSILSWIFLISLFFSIFRFFWGEWKSRVTAVKMVSPKKGWEFADASECLSFHYRNSSLYNTGLFNYINNLYAELWFGAQSRTSYQRLRATLPRSLVRKLEYPNCMRNRGISTNVSLNSSVKFYTLRIFPGKMG